MAYLRLFRRVRLAPGLSLNLSKSGPSLSLGMRGAHITVGGTGIRKTVGIPGTGIYWTDKQGYHSGVHTGEQFHGAHVQGEASGAEPRSIAAQDSPHAASMPGPETPPVQIGIVARLLNDLILATAAAILLLLAAWLFKAVFLR